MGLYYKKNFLSIYPASCFLMQKCNGKEVCIGVLEQLNSQSSFHLEKFITLLNMVKTGNVKMIRMDKSRLKCLLQQHCRKYYNSGTVNLSCVMSYNIFLLKID